VSLSLRQPAGRKQVEMLVAYGVRPDGSRQSLAFQRSSGESQMAWEGLFENPCQRGLEGNNLALIVNDSCPG
jgi:transposase-like protein